MSLDISALPGLILDQLAGFLDATKFIIPIIIPPIIAASANYWLAKTNRRYSKRVDLPVMKQREMNWDMYRKVKESGEFPEFVVALRQSFERSAEIAMWEEEVMRRTRQGSMEQKILVEMSPSTITPLRVTIYPDFKAPKSVLLYLELMLSALICISALVSMILSFIVLLIVISCIASQNCIGAIVYFIVFILCIGMTLVTQSFYQLGSGNILAGSGVVHARIVYEDIMANCYNRTVDIKASPLEKLQHVRASVVNENIRKHYCPSMQPEISTRNSIKENWRQFLLGIKLWWISACYWCGNFKPLDKVHK